MRPDQIAVVDVGVVNVLTCLHLGLKLFDNITFTDQIVCDFNARDGCERRCQGLGFIAVGIDGLGNDLDLHPRERFGSVN